MYNIHRRDPHRMSPGSSAKGKIPLCCREPQPASTATHGSALFVAFGAREPRTNRTCFRLFRRNPSGQAQTGKLDTGIFSSMLTLVAGEKTAKERDIR